MIRCFVEGEAVIVAVRVQPRASRNGVVGEHAGAVKVAVTSPPEGGRADAAVAKTVASALGLRPSAVRIIAGATSRDKLLRIKGATAEAIQRLATEASAR